MRHLLTIAMLCGLGVSTATAQSVVIVDKDGVQHKFATDRVKEITFTLETPVQPVVPLEFPSAEAEPGDNGEALLMFIDDESGKIMTLEVFGSADATFLEDGQYTVTDTREPFTINVNFANIMEGIDGWLITGGSMNVRDFSGSYSIEFDFTLSDGSEFTGSYNGPLPGYSSSDPKGSSGYALAAASTCRQVDINDPADGEFYLRLNDDAWSYEAVFDLFAPAGSTTLPDGYYEFSETGAPYTFGPRTSVDIYSPTYSSEKIVGGLITVSTTFTGGKSVTLNGTTAEGKSVTLSFDGDIEYLPAKEIQTFDLPAAAACKQSDIRDPQDGEFYLKLNDSDWSYEAVFDLFATAGSTRLPDGDYTYSDSGEAFTFGPKTSVEIYQPYSNEKITGGRITVTTNGDGTQTLTLNGTSSDGNAVNLTFSGNVEYLAEPEPVIITVLPAAEACKQSDIRDPQAGEFYLKLNDASWSYEAVLDLFAAAGATELPDGEYTYSENGEAFTFGPKTGVEIYQPYSNEKLTGGKITLSTTENGRKISVAGVTADGATITFTFEGTIVYI